MKKYIYQANTLHAFNLIIPTAATALVDKEMTTYHRIKLVFSAVVQSKIISWCDRVLWPHAMCIGCLAILSTPYPYVLESRKITESRSCHP